MQLQFKRLFLGIGFDFKPFIRIGIIKKINVFNKRKQEYQLIKRMFVIEGFFLYIGMGVLLD